MKKNLLAITGILVMFILAGGQPATAGNTINSKAYFSSFPLTINSVSAVRNRDRTVSVNWVVDKEIGTREYVLERSADGTSFSTVETVTSTANDGERNVYDMIDWNALNVMTYYRIKAVSLTGKPSYSAIVKVELQKMPSPVSVFPNPVQGKTLHVHFTNLAEGDYKLDLFNKLGQVIYTTSVTVDNSNDVRTLQLGQNIPAGTYILKVTVPDMGKSAQQVVIQ